MTNADLSNARLRGFAGQRRKFDLVGLIFGILLLPIYVAIKIYDSFWGKDEWS